ncbi:WW domain-containing protein [Madurella fahalii]|uniref:WW domain-containing protein n=1 Tax=Madurella fahalii TaxID=1157608 RepID=A0ABQ0G8Y9_9PEZI
MAALPENWEWDYDGKRWFYRYKPTGLIQYTFPKPGDEFPEYVGEGAARFDLAPEEKLVSQKQIRRRSTLGGSSSKQAAWSKQRGSSATATIAEQDDGTGPFWLQPDGLMYMGPGAYNDISPLQEEEEEAGQGSSQETAQADGQDDTATTTARVATAAAEEYPKQGTRPRAYTSPIVSAETTPLVTNSQPAVTPSETNSVIFVEAGQDATVDTDIVSSHTVPLLDNWQVEAPRDPLGFVAELPSELTAQCREETHPAPVELPSNEIMMDVTEPVVYANAFHLAPAELPSDTIPVARVAAASRADQKAETSRVPTQARKPTRATVQRYQGSDPREVSAL